jgi:hypothetical protein
MTEPQVGDNVWGAAGSATPAQRWPGLPARPADRTVTTAGQPGPAPRLRAAPPSVVVWAALALTSFLLMLAAFAAWDRPVDTPVQPQGTTVTTADPDGR